MAESSESKSINNQGIVEKAREEVRREVIEAEKATNEEEKKRKKDEIANKIKKELKEALEEIKKVKETGQPIETAIKGKLITSLSKSFEAANQGILDLPDQAKELLTRLAKANPSDTTTSAIGEYIGLYLLGDKRMIIDGKFTEVFIKDLNELKKANSNAAGLVESLFYTHRENFGITVEELIRLRVKEEGRPESSITLSEIRRIEEITEQITHLIKKKIDERVIEFSQFEKLNRAIISPQLNEDLKTTLIELGLSSEVVQEYEKLKAKYFRMPDFSYLKSFARGYEHILNAAEEEFRDLSNFFDKRSLLNLTREAKQRFSDLIKKYHYLILKKIHADRSKSFHENYSHHSEAQHALSILRQIISLSCEKIVEVLPESVDPEIAAFFQDKGEAFQSRIFTYAALFHDLPLYTRNLGTVEKIKEFFQFLFPSQLAEFFDDETGFMQIARDTMTIMLREYLIEGKNQYRGDLLSGRYSEEGVRWSQWFREKYYKRVKELAEFLGLLQGKKDEWKMDMILDYSEGVGMAFLIDGEILSTSDPVAHFREVHPLMSLLSPKHNWRGGRGRDAPGRIAKFLLHTDINLFPEVRRGVARLWKKKRFVPEEYADWVDKAIKTYGEKILDNIFDIGGPYQELLGLFNLPSSLNSWNGWRIEGMVPRELITILKFFESGDRFVLNEYGNLWRNTEERVFFERWKNVIDMVQKVYGTSAVWWTIGGAVGGAGVNRLTSDLRRFLVDYYNGDTDQVDVHYSEFFDEQKRMFGNRGRERIFNFQGVEGKLSLFEIRQIRQNQLRGESFFRYLRRNPADFLMIATQLCPELLEDNADVFKTAEVIMSLPGKTRLEKERILGRQKELKIRWGEHFDTLVNIHQWLLSKKQELNSGSIVNFITSFSEKVSLAYARHKTREEKIRRELIRIATSDLKKLGFQTEEERKQQINKLASELTFYLKEEDFTDREDDRKIWQLIAGNNGLFHLFTGLPYDRLDEYFTKFGTYNKLGEKNFFFMMAHSWFIKNSDTNPFSSDFPYYDVSKQFGTPGESTLFRSIEANIGAYKEAVSQITTLEDLLMEAARTGKLDKIYELHKKIYSVLIGSVGQEYAFRGNFILAQVVSQFFMERSILRDPRWKLLGPIGWLARWLFGKNISLSKLLTNDFHAYSMDNNGLREYFMYLTHRLGVLPEKGIWSKEHIEDVFEVKIGEFIIGDFAPSVLWYIILFILFSSIKKAIEVELNEKKK